MDANGNTLVELGIELMKNLLVLFNLILLPLFGYGQNKYYGTFTGDLSGGTNLQATNVVNLTNKSAAVSMVGEDSTGHLTTNAVPSGGGGTATNYSPIIFTGSVASSATITLSSTYTLFPLSGGYGIVQSAGNGFSETPIPCNGYLTNLFTSDFPRAGIQGTNLLAGFMTNGVFTTALVATIYGTNIVSSYYFGTNTVNSLPVFKGELISVWWSNNPPNTSIVQQFPGWSVQLVPTSF